MTDMDVLNAHTYMHAYTEQLLLEVKVFLQTKIKVWMVGITSHRLSLQRHYFHLTPRV